METGEYKLRIKNWNTGDNTNLTIRQFEIGIQGDRSQENTIYGFTD